MNTKARKVVEVCFCVVCRRSHESGRKHLYTPKHKAELKKRLDRETEKIKEAKGCAKKPRLEGAGGLTGKEKQWCLFCGMDVIKAEGQKFACEHLVRHLHDKEHVKNVRKFAFENGMEQERINSFVLSDSDYMNFQVVSGRMWNDHLEKLEKSGGLDMSSEIPENQVNTELMEWKSGIKEIHQNTSTGIHTPSIPLESRNPVREKARKTVTNHHGVRQNPTGKDENGERVWGGGIIKYRNLDDWIPWPIDNDDEGDDNVARMGNWLARKKEDSVVEQEDDDEDDGNIYTVSASGEGVTFIAPQKPRAGEGNIHTGATPPWLLSGKGDDDADDSKSEKRAQEKSFPIVRNPQGMPIPFVHPEPPKIEPAKEKEDPNWLPNFGRVWQSGTRRDTRKEFSLEQKQRKQHNEAVKTANEILSKSENQSGSAHQISGNEGQKLQQATKMTYIYHNPVYEYPPEIKESKEVEHRIDVVAANEQTQNLPKAEELSKLDEILKRKEALKARLLKNKK